MRNNIWVYLVAEIPVYRKENVVKHIFFKNRMI